MTKLNNNGWLFPAVIVMTILTVSCSVGPLPVPAVPAAGNTDTTDKIAPAFQKICPTNGSVFDSGSILISGEVKDNISPSNVYYSINSGEFTGTGITPSTNGLYLFSAALTGLSNGIYSMDVYAVDTAGNFSQTNHADFEVLILGGRVEDPVISPIDGAYLDKVDVEIVCGTSNSTIRYTLDESEPIESSILYSAPFELTTGKVVTAKAFVYAMTNSGAVSRTYTIIHKVSNTVFGTPEGTYSNDFVLGMTTPTSGASVIFSTNGGTDWVTNSSLTIERSVTVLSRSVQAGWADSDTTSAVYTMKAAVPSVPQASGTYNAGFTSFFGGGDTLGTTVMYSIDGGTAWTTNTSVIVDASLTVMVKAVKYGYSDSETVVRAYVLQPLAPVFDLADGSYPLPTNLTVSCVTPGVSVYYTLDGTTPTAGSILYIWPVALLSSKTVKAIAVIPGWSDSPMTEGSFSLPGTSIFNETNNHGAVPATNSLTGNGYDFGGLTNYMTVPSSTNNLLNIEGTVEALVYMHSFVPFAGIVHKGIRTDFADECYSLQLWTTSSVYLYLTGTNGSAVEIHSPTALTNNGWYHIVGTWNGNSMYLYINGVQVAWRAHTLGQIKTNDAPIVVGAQITNTYNTTYFNFGFDGVIDTVNLFDTMLSGTDVSERYNAILGL
ncbi:MAG: hypothetical protein A2Y33_11510 [Spirochaetes bacterium GWF1_51_8]|nr:MAG: hypothetical protein A2Y33_11510 [Spirochaetes bacterium GWF1_51_8]